MAATSACPRRTLFVVALLLVAVTADDGSAVGQRRRIQRRGRQAPSESAVPEAYRKTYDFLGATLRRARATLGPDRPGGTTRLAVSLLPANSNRGEDLLAPQTEQMTLRFIERMRDMGVQGVTLDINYPLLVPEYYRHMGKPEGTVDRISAFYARVAAAARQAGLRVYVESSQIFTSRTFSQTPVEGFYKSLSMETFERTRSAMLARIAEHVGPDCFTILEEPDTMQRETGLAVNNIEVILRLVNRGATAVKSVSPATRIGAGFGVWHADARTLAERLTRDTPIDVLNLHIYPIGGDQIGRLAEFADLARKHGKGTVIGEAWLFKIAPGERQRLAPGAVDAVVYGRDVFDFWAPLDIEFASVIMTLSQRHGIEYASFFWSTYLFAYVPWTPQLERAAPAQRFQVVNEAANAAIRNGTLSVTGEAFRRIAAGLR